jgi:hypothetical protein
MEESKYFRKKNDTYYVPCEISDEGAFPMNLSEFPANATVKEEICLQDYLNSLQNSAVIDEVLYKFNMFKSENGEI